MTLKPSFHYTDGQKAVPVLWAAFTLPGSGRCSQCSAMKADYPRFIASPIFDCHGIRDHHAVCTVGLNADFG